MQPEASRAGFRSQLPMPTRSSFELMMRNRTNKLSYFNAIKLGPKTPIAPGRGEKWPYGERFGRSFRSQSPAYSDANQPAIPIHSSR